MSGVAKLDMRDSFITSLYDVAREDRSIMILSNDFGAPSLDRFRADLPLQFVNVGISEQNMIGTAAGLAKSEKKVIVYSIATFVSLRALEQVKIDLCVMNLPVTILAVGAGYAYSTDGPTHHATEDIAVMRTLSNMTVLSPSDSAMASHLGRTFGAYVGGPRYIRLDRGKLPVIYDSESDFGRGLGVHGAGQDLAIIATGIMTHRAIEVSEALAKQNVRARVIDLYRIKPLNDSALIEAVSDVSAIATLEEHTRHGGVGGVVTEALADAGMLRPVKRAAIADKQLYAYGTRDRLHADRRLDAASLVDDLSSWLVSLRTSVSRSGAVESPTQGRGN